MNQPESSSPSVDATAVIGVVTVSDRASRGEYEDRGGPAVMKYLDEVLTSPWQGTQKIISDDQALIEQTLIDICLLYTSPSPRDGLLSRMPSSA